MSFVGCGLFGVRMFGLVWFGLVWFVYGLLVGFLYSFAGGLIWNF